MTFSHFIKTSRWNSVGFCFLYSINMAIYDIRSELGVKKMFRKNQDDFRQKKSTKSYVKLWINRLSFKMLCDNLPVNCEMVPTKKEIQLEYLLVVVIDWANWSSVFCFMGHVKSVQITFISNLRVYLNDVCF